MPLPLDAPATRRRICDSVLLHPVTIVFGATGTGKSSVVPLLLAREAPQLADISGAGPTSAKSQRGSTEFNRVLCTQPRRLAAVAVARRVAKSLDSELGDIVGYQIGQRKVFHSGTSIVFATCGILLEELRANGLEALRRFAVIILDEVHERSAESDMVLSVVREFMKHEKRIRLVLMSATCDVQRYSRYFEELAPAHGLGRGSGAVNVVAIQDAISGSMIGEVSTVPRRSEVRFLDDVLNLLPPAQALKHSTSFLEYTLCADANAVHKRRAYLTSRERDRKNMRDAQGFTLHFHQLAREVDNTVSLAVDLLLALHRQSTDLEQSILVFLPTYRTLEHAHELLVSASANLEYGFDIHALHSSIDVDECMRAIESEGTGMRRKVIIATNIAESSITIRTCAFVIDACRTLKLGWERELQREGVQVVFCSKSQAEQRRGRAGRGPYQGTVFRLIPAKLYDILDSFETPSLQLMSLRKQCLLLLCSAHDLTRDPKRMLNQCMDPPKDEVILDALATLESMGACGLENRGRQTIHAPTLFGELLCSVPISIESALLVVLGGLHAEQMDDSAMNYPALWDAVALASLLNTTPYPISQPFGSPARRRYNLARYRVVSDDDISTADRAFVLLANLTAFQFWLHQFKARRDALEQPRASTSAEWWQVSEEEEEWCRRHGLIASSLHSALDTLDAVFEALHRVRPVFLDPQQNRNCSIWFRQPPSPHSCASLTNGEDCVSGCPKAEEIYSPNQLLVLTHFLESMDGLVAAGVRADMVENPNVRAGVKPAGKPLLACAFWLMGRCDHGTACKRPHCLSDGRDGKPAIVRPPCRSFQQHGCKFGKSCAFAHNKKGIDDRASEPLPGMLKKQLGLNVNFAGFGRNWTLRAIEEACGRQQFALTLGDGDLSFSVGLAAFLQSSFVVATTLLSDTALEKAYGGKSIESRRRMIERLGGRVFHGVDATALDTVGAEIWQNVGAVCWNFPFAENDNDTNAELIRKFFLQVALYRAHARPRLFITFCNEQFSRWRVLRSSRAVGLDLIDVLRFDSEQMGAELVESGYEPRRNLDNASFDVDEAWTYVFL